jgi:hypothetical protein
MNPKRLQGFLLLAFPFAVGLYGWYAGLVAALLAAFILSALLLPRNASEFCDGTLILPRILQRVMKAYKQRMIAIRTFAMDISDETIKWKQEVFAQMPIMPTAIDHVPGSDLTADATNTITLIKDVPVRINQAAKVVLKLPTTDAVRLETDTVFETAIANAAYALGKYIVLKGLDLVTPTNFSHEIVEPLADVDKETLSTARIQLNTQDAGDYRNAIVNSTAMANLTNDPRIASGDYFGQRVEGDPYVTLTNIEGFANVTEFNKLQTTNGLLGFAFDQQAILVAIRKLSDNVEMARRLGIPAVIREFTLSDPDSGLSFTGYMWQDQKTQDIYVAVVVAFGVTGGRNTFDEDGDPDHVAANELLDNSGVRIVSAAQNPVA